MKFYRKQPIEAEQFDGSDEMVEKYELIKPIYLADDGAFEIETYVGEEVIYVGDWIVKDADEIKVLTDEEFKQRYAKLPVIPKAVADWIDKCKKDMVSICWAMDEQNLPKKVADYFRNYYTREQWIKIQDTFARAWLTGYQVEEDK